jgi:hypothetical protein
MTRPVSPTIKTRMVEMFGAGESLAEIGRVLGYSAQTVTTHVSGFPKGVRVKVPRVKEPKKGMHFTEAHYRIADIAAANS